MSVYSWATERVYVGLYIYFIGKHKVNVYNIIYRLRYETLIFESLQQYLCRILFHRVLLGTSDEN